MGTIHDGAMAQRNGRVVVLSEGTGQTDASHVAARLWAQALALNLRTWSGESAFGGGLGEVPLTTSASSARWIFARGFTGV